MIRPSERAANIEISGSKAYSIGYDPQAVIWLAGEAGWFEINPHPSYAQIYKDMCDVSQLYYALIEIFNDAGRKVLRSDRKAVLTGLDIKHILFEYAVAVGDGTTYDETVDKCVRLGPALLAHLSIATDLPWKNTSFYKWLAREVKVRLVRGILALRFPFSFTDPDSGQGALQAQLQPRLISARRRVRSLAGRNADPSTASAAGLPSRTPHAAAYSETA